MVQLQSTGWQAKDSERTSISIQAQRLDITDVPAQGHWAGGNFLFLMGESAFYSIWVLN